MDRLVRAAFVSLLTFAFAGGGIGFALAATDGLDEDTLSVPAPMQGDRAVYVAHQTIVDEDQALKLGSRLDQVTFEWMPPRLDTDADFGTRLVAVLRYEFVFNKGSEYEGTYLREASYDPLTWQPVAAAYQGEYQWYRGGLIGSTPVDSEYRHESYQGQLAPCAQATPLHGRIHAGETIAVQGRCDWGHGHETVHYKPLGWQDGPRGRSFAFQAEEDERLKVWFDNQGPFPARVLAPLTETVYEPYTLGRLWDMERVKVERGTEPYPPGLAQPIKPLGPVETAPRTAWSVDDEGVEVRFPLFEAYAAAMAEQPAPLEGPTLRQFLQERPDAYLAFAWFVEFVGRHGEHHYHWYLAFSDGKAELDKVVVLGPPGAMGLFAPATQRVVVYDWERDAESSNSGGRFPPPGLVPEELPRMAPLMERYEQMAGQPGNRYGFSILCAEGCAHAKVLAGAAHGLETLWDAGTSLAPQVQDHYASYDQITVDEHGRLEYRYLGVQKSEGALPATVPAAAEPGARFAAAALWSPPPAQAAAGLGFLALVAGALYYFWPAVKGLPLAGFSRIESGRILEHPQRARIMELLGAEPGIHFQEAARRLGLGRGSLEHHLRKLEAAGLVIRRRGQGYVCLFVRQGTDRVHLAAGAPLRSKGGRAVFDAVAARPNASFRALAAEAGIAPSTVEHHVRRLGEAGLVQQVPGQGIRLTMAGEQVRSRS